VASTLERESTAGLLSRLLGDFTALVRNEVALAKAELADSASRARAGMVALIAAVATLLAGALTLIAALILGLAEVMEPWLAALVVGVVFAAVGLVLLRGAKSKLLPPHVEIERTRAAGRHDVDVLARRT
jgi:xanthine/uracil permease